MFRVGSELRAGREPIDNGRRWWYWAQTAAVIGLRRRLGRGTRRAANDVATAAPVTVNGNRGLRPYRACRGGWRCSPIG